MCQILIAKRNSWDLKIRINRYRIFKARFLKSKVFFGLNDLDKKLSVYLDNSKGYFVELGANDGLSQSNTKHFELFKGWKGVLVEPFSDNYIRCRRNRASRTHVINAACVAFDFEEPTIRLLYSNLMTIALDGESEIENRSRHAQVGAQFLGELEEVFEFRAPARTLNSILREARSPNRIDLLSLDVEGAELEVLKGLDHSEYRFKFIVIEIRDFESMNSYLVSHGYQMVEKLTTHDYLYTDSTQSGVVN
jgi:FkbM family methyltransferase